MGAPAAAPTATPPVRYDGPAPDNAGSLWSLDRRLATLLLGDACQPTFEKTCFSRGKLLSEWCERIGWSKPSQRHDLRPWILPDSNAAWHNTHVTTCTLPVAGWVHTGMEGSGNEDGGEYELLPAGLPPRDGSDDLAGVGGAPVNAKFDPQWAQRASARFMETQGVKVVEVQQTLAELRKTQAAVARSLGDTREAVLWLQNLKMLEQQLTLVPRYKEKAQRIVHEMAAITQRVAKAKKRASKLSGEEFPEYDGGAGGGLGRTIGGGGGGRGGIGSSSR